MNWLRLFMDLRRVLGLLARISRSTWRRVTSSQHRRALSWVALLMLLPHSASSQILPLRFHPSYVIAGMSIWPPVPTRLASSLDIRHMNCPTCRGRFEISCEYTTINDLRDYAKH